MCEFIYDLAISGHKFIVQDQTDWFSNDFLGDRLSIGESEPAVLTQRKHNPSVYYALLW